MKVLFTYIFIFVSIVAGAQSVFTRVRTDQVSAHPIAHLILDSCNKANYFKDSVLYYKGMIDLKENNLIEAKLFCKELLKTYPNFTEVHFLQGLIYLSGKNYGKSINEFALALQKNPNHLKALYNRALAFGLMEEYDKAIEDLNTCVTIKPGYSLAYYSRGYWHEYLGNYPAAIKDYEATINLDPKNYDAYFGLAYIYQGQKSNAKSCEIINNAIHEGSQIAEEIKDNFCK